MLTILWICTCACACAYACECGCIRLCVCAGVSLHTYRRRHIHTDNSALWPGWAGKIHHGAQLLQMTLPVHLSSSFPLITAGLEIAYNHLENSLYAYDTVTRLTTWACAWCVYDCMCVCVCVCVFMYTCLCVCCVVVWYSCVFFLSFGGVGGGGGLIDCSQ